MQLSENPSFKFWQQEGQRLRMQTQNLYKNMFRMSAEQKVSNGCMYRHQRMTYTRTMQETQQPLTCPKQLSTDTKTILKCNHNFKTTSYKNKSTTGKQNS